MIPYWRLSGYYFFYFAFIGAFSPYFSLYLQSIGSSAAQIAMLMSLTFLLPLFMQEMLGFTATLTLAARRSRSTPRARRRWSRSTWPARRCAAAGDTCTLTEREDYCAPAGR